MIDNELGRCMVSLVFPDYHDTNKLRKMLYPNADAMRYRST